MDRYGYRDQRNRLHHVMRRVTQRAAFVIYLSDGMRVHDLNEASQKDKGDAEDCERSRPRPLKSLFVHENTHVSLTIKHNYPNRKTPSGCIHTKSRMKSGSNCQIMRAFRLTWVRFLYAMNFDRRKRDGLCEKLIR